MFNNDLLQLKSMSATVNVEKQIEEIKAKAKSEVTELRNKQRKQAVIDAVRNNLAESILASACMAFAQSYFRRNPVKKGKK